VLKETFWFNTLIEELVIFGGIPAIWLAKDWLANQSLLQQITVYF